jgi:16S rRNA (guanine527-N7)-methyltransferase
MIHYNRKRRMQSADIARILRPFLGDVELSPAQTDAVAAYLDLLLRWNVRINLTAVRDAESILARHFGESFFSVRHLFPAAEKMPSLADVGSGAGFPGLPCAIIRPISLTLIEASQKKSVFLREVVRALSLADVTVLNARAEDVSDTFDVVTLRAVERFEAILPTAASLVAPAGRLALLIGSSQFETARTTLAAWQWDEPVPIPLSRSRILAVARKR